MQCIYQNNVICVLKSNLHSQIPVCFAFMSAGFIEEPIVNIPVLHLNN